MFGLGKVLGATTRLVNTPIETVDRVVSSKGKNFDDDDRFVSTPLEELAKSLDSVDDKNDRRW